ncbi:hypothetical protein [Dyadobacter sp. CY312]|uniref:hypothetical protein n=1 Tax=Dyadobacter sp. CY312 TaxID=2907303 RepID=UPI001F490718|nr:hypothetical protein [Dyadobacter sp. CY312]MCE7038994.1 hypothetical protein [Dyadobacter sp. CY312]
MGLAPSELEHITPGQFNLMREGYEQGQVHEWERSRFVAYWVYTMAGKVASGDISIEQFRPLSQDDLNVAPSFAKIPEYTEAQKEKLHKLFNPGK